MDFANKEYGDKTTQKEILFSLIQTAALMLCGKTLPFCGLLFTWL